MDERCLAAAGNFFAVSSIRVYRVQTSLSVWKGMYRSNDGGGEFSTRISDFLADLTLGVSGLRPAPRKRGSVWPMLSQYSSKWRNMSP